MTRSGSVDSKLRRRMRRRRRRREFGCNSECSKDRNGRKQGEERSAKEQMQRVVNKGCHDAMVVYTTSLLL